MTWTKDLPTAPGWYWFYGTKSGAARADFASVRVFKIANGVGRVIDGSFLFAGEDYVGVYSPAALPEPPEVWV